METLERHYTNVLFCGISEVRRHPGNGKFGADAGHSECDRHVELFLHNHLAANQLLDMLSILGDCKSIN